MVTDNMAICLLPVVQNHKTPASFYSPGFKFWVPKSFKYIGYISHNVGTIMQNYLQSWKPPTWEICMSLNEMPFSNIMSCFSPFYSFQTTQVTPATVYVLLHNPFLSIFTSYMITQTNRNIKTELNLAKCSFWLSVNVSVANIITLTHSDKFS